MKYSSKITGHGELAFAFLDDPDMNFIIIFNDNAPKDLAEISILHTQAELLQDPAPGDTFIIGSKVFDITAVGDEALHTLRELGHCTLSFKGGKNPERPGCIMLDGGEALTVEDLEPGGKIEIF